MQEAIMKHAGETIDISIQDMDQFHQAFISLPKETRSMIALAIIASSRAGFNYAASAISPSLENSEYRKAIDKAWSDLAKKLVEK